MIRNGSNTILYPVIYKGLALSNFKSFKLMGCITNSKIISPSKLASDDSSASALFTGYTDNAYGQKLSTGSPYIGGGAGLPFSRTDYMYLQSGTFTSYYKSSSFSNLAYLSNGYIIVNGSAVKNAGYSSVSWNIYMNTLNAATNAAIIYNVSTQTGTEVRSLDKRYPLSSDSAPNTLFTGSYGYTASNSVNITMAPSILLLNSFTIGLNSFVISVTFS